MPVNAPFEYYIAEEKFKSAKSKEEKIVALEEMIRLLPKHHGSETASAQLKARLAKLRKESSGKRGGHAPSIVKEGDAQICLVGLTNSGKSFLLKELTDAEPEVADHPYTTTKPEVGMMDYKGIKVQIIEIPSTFLPEYMSIARTSDRILLVIKEGSDKEKLMQLLESNFIRSKSLFVNPWRESPEEIKEKIWHSLGLIIVYTKKTNTPMALPYGSTIKEFAHRIHKDFVKNFRFARIIRNKRMIQAGINYRLQNGDVVEIYMK